MDLASEHGPPRSARVRCVLGRMEALGGTRARQPNGASQMKNEERILIMIRSSAGGLTDREIGEHTGIRPHQQVNQICNRLARKGLTRRECGPQGLLLNVPAKPDGSLASQVLAHIKERRDKSTGLPEIDLRSTLIVIPCSGRKREGGVKGRLGGVSVIDLLPENLSDELKAVRDRNAPACQVNESSRMPAVERYSGTLYEAAGTTLAQLSGSVGGVAIISGGYGVVLASEQIGWYDQRFRQAMWPDNLVARCLSAYAEAIGATTVVGLFGATTSYASAFQRAKWPIDVQNVRLVSPVLRGRDGGLSKVPRAIGEALVAIASTGTLPTDWRSSDALPVHIMSIEQDGSRR